MNATKLLGIAMAAALLSTGAMAATMTPAQQCIGAAEAVRYGNRQARHGRQGRRGEDVAHRCREALRSGKDADGVKKLEQALNDIGVKPQS